MTRPDVAIYVVDDDDSVRRAIARLLMAARYRVVTFASAGEFLQHDLQDGACVLLDVRMPGITGFDVFRRLVRSRPDVTVIFMTGHVAVDLAPLGADGEAVDVLMKPLSEQTLLAAIDRAIERSLPSAADPPGLSPRRGTPKVL